MPTQDSSVKFPLIRFNWLGTRKHSSGKPAFAGWFTLINKPQDPVYYYPDPDRENYSAYSVEGIRGGPLNIKTDILSQHFIHNYRSYVMPRYRPVQDINKFISTWGLAATNDLELFLVDLILKNG